MRLFTRAGKFLKRLGRLSKDRSGRAKAESPRRCLFEAMEPRQLLAAAPLFVGAVYIEQDVGSDLQGDTFEITFQGGAKDTKLTRIAISGDQNNPGFGVGDTLFDTNDTGLGADHGFPLTVLSLQTVDPAATVSASVQDGGTLLVLDLSGFHAGDRLVFTIDVDEVEDWDPSESDLDVVNEGLDPLTSGVEFQGSTLVAEFASPHYHEASVTTEFRNRYDTDLQGTGLILPEDNVGGQRDRTAGAVGSLQQEPLPVSVAGTVYLDVDLNLQQAPSEIGIAGVVLELWKSDGAGYQDTGHTATTDSNGDYTFGVQLDLKPGVYQVRQQQPAGLFSVGAIPGTVDGSDTGANPIDDPDVLTDIVIALGDQHAIDFDFAEAEPAAIGGHVYHDRDNDAARDAGEEGIPNAQLQIVPVDTIAPQSPVSVSTDAQGWYRVDGLAPGTYRLVQANQPSGYLDGLDAAGTVDGQPRGTAVNPGDTIEGVFLGGGQTGVDYDFGELVPASIRGRVCLADRYGDCFVAGTEQAPVANALVKLLGQQGTVLAETRTDALGQYAFDGLAPGVYSLAETTPDDLIDGQDHVGTIDGVAIGRSTDGDLIVDISLASGDQALNYDFCEHLPAEISGYVYHDRDNDGVRQVGQTGIADVQITLLDDAGEMVATAVTDGGGLYEFAGLSAGIYTIVQSQPGSWVDGLDRAGTIGGVAVGTAANPGDAISAVALYWGDVGIEYNFGELRYASIQGSVHLTGPEGDCYTPDGDQPPLSGVTVSLLDESGETIAETQTDASGAYLFPDLLPGTYTVVESTPGELIDGPERVGSVDGIAMGQVEGDDRIGGIVLLSGQSGTGYDFCEHQPGSISGVVYHDADDNGLFAQDELPIAGVAVQLLDASGTVIDATLTDSTGYYAFGDLPAGQYAVRETQPAGYLDGRDTAGRIDGRAVGTAANPGDRIEDIEFQWGDVGVHYNFGELLTGSLEGLVHTDLDGDCQFDSDEAPLANVTLQLLDEDGQIVATQQTDADGRYRFDNLTPGTYTVREQQPAGYFHGGQRAGSGGGDDRLDDVISAIAIGSAQDLTDYDFCEVPPATLSGLVHTDLDGDCQFDSDEAPLANVTVQLLNEHGQVIATQQTGIDGTYRFDNLTPGTYTVREQQPSGYLQGGQRAGSGGGDDSLNDVISAITVRAGQNLTDYDFCEVPPATLSGLVHTDLDGDCQFDSNETLLADVTVQLLDGNGSLVATQQTDNDGTYRFENLRPGNYAVREQQPIAYFHGGQQAGSHGGDDSISDLITQIVISGGQRLTDYNFCENPPGILSGYVFQDGDTFRTPDGQPPENVWELRDGLKTPDDKPLAGVVLQLRNGISGDFITGEMTLPGSNPSGPMTTVTDENGYYEFRGLPRGNYAVYEIHPEGFVDGIDTAGTTSGIAVNPNSELDMNFIRGLSVAPNNDAIVLIPLAPGAASLNNNFSEIAVERSYNPLPVTPPAPVAVPPLTVIVAAPPSPSPIMAAAYAPPQYVSYGTGGTQDFSWHLSIIDAGAPRGTAVTRTTLAWRSIAYNNSTDWYAQPIDQGRWSLGLPSSRSPAGASDDAQFEFGLQGGIPVVGDFNGDGVDEIGIYRDGYWFLDLNGNGRWDDEDLWAQLGEEFDLPLTGDWNGDGKDDIGIFGPAWAGDMIAMSVEAGLPDLRNRVQPVPKPKNVPPAPQEATSGVRLLRHTTQGATRADVIDHVFRYGAGTHVPVAGDWSGDGIKNIGVFRDGHWHLDADGNGRWSEGDRHLVYGRAGDLPIVGDWDGDGISEIGVYRAGTWIVDMDGNQQLDAHDVLFSLGEDGDLPVVGDWNGDGVDQPGVYHDAKGMLQITRGESSP